MLLVNAGRYNSGYMCPLWHNSGSQAHKARQRSPIGKLFWKSIHARNFGYDVSVRPCVPTVGVEVGRQDSVWGQKCSDNSPWGKIAWQRCIWQPAFFWWEIIFVTSDGIKSRKQEVSRLSPRQTDVLSDNRLRAKLRVTEIRCVLFNPSTYVYLALLPQH